MYVKKYILKEQSIYTSFKDIKNVEDIISCIC